MNIDSLGPETVDDYYRRGLIRDVADLYDIQVQQINGEDGTREKSAQKIVRSIADSVEVPFERVVFALGIRFVGEIAAKALARHFKSMDALASASLEDMLQINGIGVVIAESVIRYFANEANRDLVLPFAGKRGPDGAFRRRIEQPFRQVIRAEYCGERGVLASFARRI